MRLTVLGGCGGFPAAGLACSGYLVEHDGFRLLLTHLWPGTDPDAAVRAAAGSYPGEVSVASAGLVADILGE